MTAITNSQCILESVRRGRIRRYWKNLRESWGFLQRIGWFTRVGIIIFYALLAVHPDLDEYDMGPQNLRSIFWK
jgi:hypothetical protein